MTTRSQSPAGGSRRRPPVEARTAPGSPAAAAFLSFLLPGLGQLYLGRRRAAALFAAPVILIAAAFVGIAMGGVGRLVQLLFTPSSALTLMILVLLVGLWRLLAMGDAATGLLGSRRNRRRGLAAFAVLSAFVVLSHGWLGYVAWSFWDASERVFVAGSPDSTPRASLAPGETPDPAAEFDVAPVETPATPESRVNILLTGIDSAETRSHALTDTLMVVSLDPVSGDVAMVSFPRDIADFPLWRGGVYHSKINSFMTYARTHPAEFPDGPLPSLVKELGFLLGVPIHYYAAVDLAGFRKLIDLAGGVTIENATAINDPRYDWLDGRRGFVLPAGRHTLDGQRALAYVRSRYSAGDNDFNRARRQQQVLLALRQKLTTPESVLRIPELTQAAGDTIRTNLPTDRLGEFVDLAQRMNEDSIVQKVLGPPYAIQPTVGVSDYRLRFDMDRLARLSIELFGEDSRYASASE